LANEEQAEEKTMTASKSEESFASEMVPECLQFRVNQNIISRSRKCYM